MLPRLLQRSCCVAVHEGCCLHHAFMHFTCRHSGYSGWPPSHISTPCLQVQHAMPLARFSAACIWSARTPAAISLAADKLRIAAGIPPAVLVCPWQYRCWQGHVQHLRDLATYTVHGPTAQSSWTEWSCWQAAVHSSCTLPTGQPGSAGSGPQQHSQAGSALAPCSGVCTGHSSVPTFHAQHCDLHGLRTQV